ncbi:hypothetical protein HNR16_000813 [Pseudoclavibacter chungangensis]|nr:hypothetical protein [Pseudoclavibacter chungangensis]
MIAGDPSACPAVPWNVWAVGGIVISRNIYVRREKHAEEATRAGRAHG